jgi:DNA repair photolyase
MIVRDVDVLLYRTSPAAGVSSVPSVDEEAWAALEPGTAHPLQRLRAVRQLRDAGVNAGVLMAPVVPGFTTQPAKLEATIKAIADHGALFMGANLMYLKGGTKDHFMGFLAKEFPHMVDGYNRLYAGAYASAAYVRAVRGMIDTLQRRYDVGRRRPEADRDVEHEKAPEQSAFSWMEDNTSDVTLSRPAPRSARRRARR